MARIATFAAATFLMLPSLAGSAQAQDAAELVVRLNRLEGQMRQMSGQIEQLQFDNRTLKDQVRKFQEDVEFRFQERAGGRASAPSTQPARPPAAQPEGRPARRSDAFDPEQEPAAPGAPRQLGATAPSAPIGSGEGSLRRSGRREADNSAFSEGQESDGPLDLSAMRNGGGAATAPSPRSTASLPPPPAAGGDARSDYDIAYAYVMQRRYEQAETALRQFLAAHPRDRLAADATYWLGESYLQRSRPREAAEQFLKISTDYTRSAKAPDALLKLGMSLSALGAHDQACATFAELDRKYPDAAASVKQGAEREQKRARCPA